MIKYIEYDSQDEHGQHIIPVNTLSDLTSKVAMQYSPELMKVIASMKRDPSLYYVVINALGSHEVWGGNRNGDTFPRSGLEHKSLRTDMGTANDYGYKTFEYYAKLFRHHANKPVDKHYGEVIYSFWNADMQRVELIVGIYRDAGADIVAALDKGDQVSVSMGCKLKYDLCNICGNKATKRENYCKHLKSHLGEIIDAETAKKWSIELNKTILPGTHVLAINEFPKFFDISRVYVGADRTAFVLGKAASKGMVSSSLGLGEASGVTDADINKLAQVKKTGEIDKEINPDAVNGQMVKSDIGQVVRKAFTENIDKSIAAEPMIDNDLLDSISAANPLSNIFSTMLGLGIHPKPAEFQRIVLVRIGQKPLADDLESKGMVFNPGADVAPVDINVDNKNFVDGLARVIASYVKSRSSHPDMLMPRIELAKTATIYNAITGPDYWLRPQNAAAGAEAQVVAAQNLPANIATALAGLASLYIGLKAKSMGYGARQIAEMFSTKPWLGALIGGSVVSKIYSTIGGSEMRPASDYEGILQNTNFSGHMKQAELAKIASAVVLPKAYMERAAEQSAMVKVGKSRFMTKIASNGVIGRLGQDDLARLQNLLRMAK